MNPANPTAGPRCPAVILLVTLLAGCAAPPPDEDAGPAWEPLFDGTTTTGWTGDWTVEDGELVRPEDGRGGLRTVEMFGDFHIRLEFYIDPGVNSGLFVRCPEGRGGPRACYELNIYDEQRNGYGTGSVVNIALPATPVETTGRWNTFEARLEGSRIRLWVNGVQTVDVEDETFPGPGQISLQAGSGGDLRFRNIYIRRL